MSTVLEKIEANLTALKDRMAQAAVQAGRAPEEVLLLPVTKTVGIEEVQALHQLGLREMGENRVEVAKEKIEAMGKAVRWHMIGSVQRRKARDVAALFDVVDSIDRLSLAAALQKRCEEQDRQLEALVEVNVSGEESKHGFTAESLAAAMPELRAFDHLRLKGLMTMAPLGAPDEVVRGVFRGLKELADRYELPELSMGMTDDFEVAIEEGATQVRVGRALFV